MALADPREILKFVSITPGMKVGDFGAGSGAYSSAILDRVGEEGAVYALDALPQSLERIRRSAQGSGKRCMTICTEFENELPLRDNLLDVAVVANTLHEVDPTRRPHFLGELHRVVAPGGKVLVVDWAGSFNNMGPPAPMVLPPIEAVRLFRAAGFTTSPLLPAGTHHYAFVALLPAMSA